MDVVLDIDSAVTQLSFLSPNTEGPCSAFQSTTIVSQSNGCPAAHKRAQRMLRRLSESSQGSLAFFGTLGEGGMGIVRVARQCDLGRDVAVKILRPENKGSEAAIGSMLREAWVTGKLEHPNIVPIYYADMDEEGKPQIVLKRIEGVVWTTLVGDAEAVGEKFGTVDLLGWNLGVLETVGNAIRYAHSRGIVHRDLKPDNVMIGSFGEVYLLDWGIAVSLVDDGETLLPIVDALDSEIVGTPGYMAPEMLGEDGSVDTRTDVYLLGALLYRLLTGCPPHSGPGIEKTVASIRRSKPEFGGEVSPDLAAICSKAMAANAADRYQSADDFCAALREYRTHHTSRCLSQRASVHLDSLRERAAAGDRGDILQYTLGKCQFGFQSSLEAWPENQDARLGLQEAIEIVAEVELLRGDPRIAKRLLRELDTPDASLMERCNRVLRTITQSEENRAELEQQMDSEMGQGVRLFLLVVFGFGWTWIEVWARFAGRTSNASHTLMMVTTLIYIAVFSGLVFFVRHTLIKTVVNRQFSGALFVILLHQLLATATGQALGFNSEQVYALWMLIWSATATMTVVTIDRRIWPTALAIATCLVVTSFSMDLRLYAMTGFTVVMIANGFFLWMPRDLNAESNS